MPTAFLVAASPQARCGAHVCWTQSEGHFQKSLQILEARVFHLFFCTLLSLIDSIVDPASTVGTDGDGAVAAAAGAALEWWARNAVKREIFTICGRIALKPEAAGA